MILNLSFASKMVRRSDTPAPCSSRRLGFIWFLPPTYDPLPTSVLFRRRFNASGKKNTQWWPPHPFRKVRSVLAAETKRNETKRTTHMLYSIVLYSPLRPEWPPPPSLAMFCCERLLIFEILSSNESLLPNVILLLLSCCCVKSRRLW